MITALLKAAENRRTRWFAAGLLLALAGGASCAQAEEKFYRYENAEGITVIDDHVPPQFAPKGYSVLNRAGRVIEVVPRALTEAERKSDSVAVQARLRAEEAGRQKRYDEQLLARYSSVSDIEDMQRRKVGEVQVKINLQKGTMADLRQQLEKQQAQAAELEMGGASVDPVLQKNIDDLRASIAQEEAGIAKLEQEKKTTEARYRFDIERFRAISRGG